MFDVIKGETLACFFVIYSGGNDEDRYWKFEFYQIKDNSIIAHENYSSLQMAQANDVKYFKAEINFNKTKALICGLLDYGANTCFKYNSSQTQFLAGYTFLIIIDVLWKIMDLKLITSRKKMNFFLVV